MRLAMVKTQRKGGTRWGTEINFMVYEMIDSL